METATASANPKVADLQEPEVTATLAPTTTPSPAPVIDINSKGDGSDRDVLAANGLPKALIKQKCVFTANPVSRTPFNVTATPFVSAQMRTASLATSTPKSDHHHQLHATSSGHLVQLNGATASGGSPHHHVQQHHLPPPTARMCAPALAAHMTPIPHSGPKGVDGRIWRSISARHVAPMFSYEDELNRIHTSHSQYSIPFSTRPRNHRDFIDSSRSCGPIALPNGTIQIRLRDGIRVDMTLDKAVRVINCKSRIAISLASTASSAALIHPNGKVYQYGTRVEIVAYDGMQTNNYVRYAKMWYKGVSFTSENCALIYLVDTAGTRTTTDSFTDMSKDYTISVFLNDSRHGSIYAEEALATLQNSTCNDDGTEVFDINGFRITQTADGLVKVTRSNNKCLIRTSPGNGSATLTTPFMHCTASLGQTSHLFVRRGERRMHFDGSSFVVRNAGHSAGFDDNNLLKVY